jgi:hypothetical protein
MLEALAQGRRRHQDRIMPICTVCGRRMACTLCEAWVNHCQARDPIRCAQEALAESLVRYGTSDPHTISAREQLKSAELMALAAAHDQLGQPGA